MIEKPYPGLEEILGMIGNASTRMGEIGACEGTAGNISVCLRWDVDVHELFPNVEKIALPQPVPELAGAVIILSGSGRHLRDIDAHPTANLACLVIDKDGQTADQYTAPHCNFHKVSSEFPSHLVVHYDRVLSTCTNFHSVIHVHPPYLTYLSHIKRYQNTHYLNTHLLRWQPETVVNLPEGIGFAPFETPGSGDLVATNAMLFRDHQVVLWAKHGIMSCSDTSIKHAVDIIEYSEASARYEFFNLSTGEIGDGLSVEEIQDICTAFHVKQSFF